MPQKKPTVAQSLHLESIKGELLDKLLAKGWYRMGASFFTSHYIHYNEGLYSAVWLRNELKTYTLSKSLRKLTRKNKERFSHKVEPYRYTEELENLYQAYKTSFKGEISESLSGYMMKSLKSGIFDTRLVLVYDHDKLIACSIFDMGSLSIASIFGFYDPAYRQMSLGLYTMLFIQVGTIKRNVQIQLI